MGINDKIKQILIDKNLTPSYFADEIGVQRSSISHILSGRNRPSFDIIQKIIRRFPELGYEWIMEEDNQFTTSPSGYPTRSGSSAMRSTPDQFSAGPAPVSYAPQPITIRSQRNEIPPAGVSTSASVEPSAPLIEQPVLTNEKKVERILIFYTDGSFREYTPTN
ncbi:helix-turn-helix transcriptional regulator [Spirosoma jeollabukense]